MRGLLQKLKREPQQTAHPQCGSGGVPSFDFALAPSRLDAHELYAEARTASPLCFDPMRKEWMIVGYEAAVWAFKNPQILSSKYQSDFDPLVVGNDPPKHTAYRKILSRAMAGCDAAVVETYTSDWMDKFIRRAKEKSGLFDAVHDLACPLPESFTGVMMGLDEAETQNLIAMRPLNRTQLNSSWPDVTAYLRQLVANTRARRRGGVFGALASISGTDALLDEEISGLLRLLWFAGTSTSTHFLPSLLLLMLRNPDFVKELRSDLSLLPAFVNEALRMEGPTGVLPRKAVEDFELAGVHIPAKAMVKICILAANSDPAVFPGPREIKLNRPTPSVAFGHGIHFCLGAMIAKTMAIKVAEALILQCPAMRAAQDLNAVSYEPSDAFRSVKSLQTSLS